MSVSSPVPDNDPRMIAWNAYKATDDYANTVKWALDTDVQNNLRQQYVEGSLWASFIQGFEAGGTAQATPREDELQERVADIAFQTSQRILPREAPKVEGAEQQEEAAE